MYNSDRTHYFNTNIFCPTNPDRQLLETEPCQLRAGGNMYETNIYAFNSFKDVRLKDFVSIEKSSIYCTSNYDESCILMLNNNKFTCQDETSVCQVSISELSYHLICFLFSIEHNLYLYSTLVDNIDNDLSCDNPPSNHPTRNPVNIPSDNNTPILVPSPTLEPNPSPSTNSTVTTGSSFSMPDLTTLGIWVIAALLFIMIIISICKLIVLCRRRHRKRSSLSRNKKIGYESLNEKSKIMSVSEHSSTIQMGGTN